MCLQDILHSHHPPRLPPAPCTLALRFQMDCGLAGDDEVTFLTGRRSAHTREVSNKKPQKNPAASPPLSANSNKQSLTGELSPLQRSSFPLIREQYKTEQSGRGGGACNKIPATEETGAWQKRDRTSLRDQ